MKTTEPSVGGPILSVSSRLLGDGEPWQAAEAAARLGFQGVELWTEPLRRVGSARWMRRRLEAIPVRRYLHVPFYDLNPCAANPRIRRVSLAEMRRALRTASALGIRQVVIHPGHASNSKGDVDAVWPMLVETLDSLCAFADRLGLRVAIEAMERRPKELLVRPEDVARLFSDAPGLRAGVCLDFAHAWTVDEACAERFINQFDGRIIHTHLSNVHGEKIHLPLDRGESPISPSALRFLRCFDGPLTLEGASRAWPHAAEVGIASMHHLLKEGGDGTSSAEVG